MNKLKKKTKEPSEEATSKLRKTKQARINTVRTYVVGLTLLQFRKNLLIKVRANNDYYAILEAMRRFTMLQAEEYPEKFEHIEEAWEAEEKRLTSRCKTFDDLHNYLCMVGFVVSKPLIIKEDRLE
jgi:hypothetical protein